MAKVKSVRLTSAVRLDRSHVRAGVELEVGEAVALEKDDEGHVTGGVVTLRVAESLVGEKRANPAKSEPTPEPEAGAPPKADVTTETAGAPVRGGGRRGKRGGGK